MLSSSALRVYQCNHCGATISHGALQCAKCHHEFTHDDVTTILEMAKASSRTIWREVMHFSAFMCFILMLIAE